MKIVENTVFKLDGKTWKTLSLENRSWKCVELGDENNFITISCSKIKSIIQGKESFLPEDKESFEKIVNSIQVGELFFDEDGSIWEIIEMLQDSFWVCQLTDAKDNEDRVILSSDYIGISIFYFGKAMYFKNNEKTDNKDEIEKIKKEFVRESLRNYASSETGRAALKKYRKTENGRNAVRKAIKKYFQTPKGKETKKRYMKKYQNRDDVKERRREKSKNKNRNEYMKTYMQRKRKEKKQQEGEKPRKQKQIKLATPEELEKMTPEERRSEYNRRYYLENLKSKRKLARLERSRKNLEIRESQDEL